HHTASSTRGQRIPALVHIIETGLFYSKPLPVRREMNETSCIRPTVAGQITASVGSSRHVCLHELAFEIRHVRLAHAQTCSAVIVHMHSPGPLIHRVETPLLVHCQRCN